MLFKSLTSTTIRGLCCSLLLIASGCHTSIFHRKSKAEKACCVETLGIDDTICYGHQKTCWRTWDEAAWAATGCPTTSEPIIFDSPLNE